MDSMKGMFQGFDIAAAGLRAEMARAQVVAANISNANRTGNPDPYRRKSLLFSEVLAESAGTLRGIDGSDVVPAGVEVSGIYEDHTSPFVPKYDPGHPDADDRGFVLMSNVDLMRELVDLSVIERSYQANLAAMNTYRGMVRQTIERMAT